MKPIEIDKSLPFQLAYEKAITEFKKNNDIELRNVEINYKNGHDKWLFFFFIKG